MLRGVRGEARGLSANPPPSFFSKWKLPFSDFPIQPFTLGFESYTACLYDDILQLYTKWINYVLNLSDFTTKWVVLQTWKFLQNGL